MEAASLDGFFVLLEKELQRHLLTFVAAQGQSGVDVSGIASHDVRLMLNNLAKRWQSPQQANSIGGIGGGKKNLWLDGSPVISANFLTILAVLHCYHHKSPSTHWEVIEQGHECALRLLRALHTYGGIDTTASVSHLVYHWRAVDKNGQFAFDHTPKIVVEEIAQSHESALSRGGASPSTTAPKLLLEGLPAEVNVSAVMWALQAQDIDVTEAMIHLTNNDDGSKPYVELNSVTEQRDLLELGTITIKRTTVQFVKPEETREVVLHLPKRLHPQAIASAWENEFGHCLTDDHIVSLDGEGHLTVVRLTPEQYAEVEGKEITLVRKQIKLLPLGQHHVKLLLPSAEMSTETARAVVRTHLAGEAHQLLDLVRVDDKQAWAVAHLGSSTAKSTLLQRKYLTVTLDDLPAKASNGPTFPGSVDSSITTASVSATAHRQWYPPSSGPIAAHPVQAKGGPVTVSQSNAEVSSSLHAGVKDGSPLTSTNVEMAAGQPVVKTEQLKDLALLHYLKKQGSLLDGLRRMHSVSVEPFNQGKAGFVRIVGSATPNVHSAWHAIDAALGKVISRKELTFLKFQDPLIRTYFKKKLQALHTFSPTTAVYVETEPGTGTQPVTVYMVGTSESDVAALDKEVTRARVRISVDLLQPPETETAVAIGPEHLKRLFDVLVALDPKTRRLRVVGFSQSIKALVAHISGLRNKTTATAQSSPPVVPAPVSVGSATSTTTTTSFAAKDPAPSPPVANASNGALPVGPQTTGPSSISTPHHQQQQAQAIAPPGGSGPAPAVVRSSSSEKEEEDRTVMLSPLPEGVTVSDLAALAKGELGIEPTFVAVREGQAYIRYRPTTAATAGRVFPSAVQQISLGADASIRVEPIKGEVPAWKLCLRSESAASLKKDPEGLIASELLSALRSLTAVEALELGRVQMWRKLVTVEVGSEACLLRLRQSFPSSMTVLRASLSLSDETCDKIEELEHVCLVVYLAKRKESTLAVLESEHSVSISPLWGHSVSDPRPASVRIGGRSPEAVDLAWQDVQAVLRSLVRKTFKFKFAPEDALMRKCFKAKLKELHDRCGPTAAVYFEDQTAAVVVTVVGDDEGEVTKLALEPNRIRPRLAVDRSLPAPTVGPTPPAWDKLAQTCDVVIELDPGSADRIAVAGYRDAVTACVARIKALATVSGSAAVPPKAPPDEGEAGPPASAPEQKQVKTVTIEYKPEEAFAVNKLQLSIVDVKYGVSAQINDDGRVITLSSAEPSSVARAEKHIRKFIKRGTKMYAAKIAGGPEATLATSSTTSTLPAL